MKNVELVLAPFYQKLLGPVVSLAPDPAQKVSLLHQLPAPLPVGPGFIPIELKTTELLKNNRATVVFDSPERAV